MILYIILLYIILFILCEQLGNLLIFYDIFDIDQFYFRMFCFFYCQIYCKFVDGWVFFFLKKKRKLCIRLSYINNNVVFELFYD